MERRQLPRMTSCMLGLMVVILHINVIWSLALRGFKASGIKRQQANMVHAPGQLGCIHMESLSGDYWYQSPGDNNVCGLYLIAAPDQIIEVQFTGFDVSCDDGGLLATLDGWETQGQIFPGNADHKLSLKDRYKTYCGDNAPTRTFVTSQNVGLIQFRIPKARDGFRISIRLIDNDQLCNVVSMASDGIFTLRNFGERRNCSVSFLYPETISIVDIDVGVTFETNRPSRQTGGMVMCSEVGHHDRVELLGGEGLDPAYMAYDIDFCGLDSMPGIDLPQSHIACSHSVVRLVSSGEYFNSVTFMHTTLTSLDQPEGNVFTQCFNEF